MARGRLGYSFIKAWRDLDTYVILHYTSTVLVKIFSNLLNLGKIQSKNLNLCMIDEFENAGPGGSSSDDDEC